MSEQPKEEMKKYLVIIADFLYDSELGNIGIFHGKSEREEYYCTEGSKDVSKRLFEEGYINSEDMAIIHTGYSD